MHRSSYFCGAAQRKSIEPKFKQHSTVKQALPQHPNPNLPFVVEVVLSKRHGKPMKTLPLCILLLEKNLECIKHAKPPHHVKWVLFFNQFHFTVTYQPSVKNSKAEALSSCHDPIYQPTDPEPILPFKSILLAPIHWNLMEGLHQAQQSESPPPVCPLDKQYVPTRLHQQVIQWTYTVPSSGHPGIRRTINLV